MDTPNDTPIENGYYWIYEDIKSPAALYFRQKKAISRMALDVLKY